MQRLINFFEDFDSLRTKITVSPYIFLALAVITASFLQYVVQEILKIENTPLLMYIMVPVISSWYGGVYAGIASTIMSVLVADFFFIGDPQSVLQTSREIGRATVFTIQGIVISVLTELRNRSDNKRLMALSSEVYLRKELEKSKKSRDDFISMTTHELKTPLTSIKTYIQLLQHMTERDHNLKYGMYITKLEEQSNRMVRYIDDLLNISKLQVGKLEITRSYVDLNECLEEILEVYKNTNVSHEIIVNGKIKHKIYADKTRIIQVLTNLISNAVKYSPNAKQVSITISETHKYISVSVQDFGVGINKTNRAKLFSKYFRVDGLNENKYKGFGIGLYLVSEIVKLHGGKIGVKSIQNKGSVFTVKFPVQRIQSFQKN